MKEGQLDTTFLSKGSTGLEIPDAQADTLFSQALAQACAEVSSLTGRSVSSVLLIPPDITRFYSRAGFLTGIACRELAKAGMQVTVLPALGTHFPVSSAERERMFPDVPESLFRVHDWRNDIVGLGRIEQEWVEKAFNGAVGYDWPVQVNKLLMNGGFDLIVSLGQVVPHEAIGMANHTKNIFVGTGGKEAIDKSHYAGAVLGLERIIGRIDTPVRAMFDEGMRRFGDKLPPILYVLTVIDSRESNVLRGLYCGFGRECFLEAAVLSRQVNVELMDEPIQKAVVYLEPEKFRTTWLGNKAIYRTRMAMANGGELLIIAPGLERFGEDSEIDMLIRKHGYRSEKVIRERVGTDPELADNLNAAAHLIHSAVDDRFTVRYFPGPHMSRREIEDAGFAWGNIDEAMARYNVRNLSTGWNTSSDGEKFFFVSDPALGLWALRSTFE